MLTAYGLAVGAGRSGQVLFPFNETFGASGGYTVAFGNGDLHVTVGFQPHGPGTVPRVTRAKRSQDKGRTWQRQPVNPATNRSQTEFGQNSAGLGHGGEVISFTGFDERGLCCTRQAFTSGSAPVPARPGWSTIKVQLARSRDFGQTQRIETVDLLHPTPLRVACVGHANIVAVDNGTKLLAVPYGILAGLDPVWVQPDGRKLKYQYTRSFVIASSDNGTSWEYLSTVASSANDLGRGIKVPSPRASRA